MRQPNRKLDTPKTPMPYYASARQMRPPEKKSQDASKQSAHPSCERFTTCEYNLAFTPTPPPDANRPVHCTANPLFPTAPCLS